jgi:hypothetical protein
LSTEQGTFDPCAGIAGSPRGATRREETSMEQDEGPVGAARPTRGRPWTRSGAAICWTVVALALAVAVGWAGFGGASGAAAGARQNAPAAEATATREAELAELAALQTEVARLQAQIAEECAEPTPTVEPTPVPPVAAGQALPHGDGWTVVVVGATARPAVGTEAPDGVFVELALTVTNNGDRRRTFMATDLVLVDAQGRTYVVDTAATAELDMAWGVPVPPSEPSERRLVYDVAADAGQTFVVESMIDPTFRVAVTLAQRG